MLKPRLFLLLIVAGLLGTALVEAQRRFGLSPSSLQKEDPTKEFAIVRWYSSGWQGDGWSHDYPTAEEHILQIMREVSVIDTDRFSYKIVDLASPARVFAVTFDHFGTYAAGAITYTEKVELRFYDGTFTVGSVTLAGCNADGGLASFSNIDPGGFFDSISIVPISATGSPGGSSDSSLLVADLKACDSTSGNCRTTLWSGTNKCD